MTGPATAGADDHFALRPTGGFGINLAMRMAVLRSVGAVVVLTMVVTGCASPAPRVIPKPATPTNRTVSLPSTSGTRTALVHRPAGLGPGAPLVVVLHGAYGSASQVKATFGWDALADRARFEVAYPNGVARFWNAGSCCGSAHNRHVDDVDFLHRLAIQLVDADGLDPRRVYAVGMSNGAMMAYAWACGYPDDLAGIGPVAGALVAPCDPAPAITVVAIHGTADRNVPIGGGSGPRSVTHYDYPSLAESLAPFVAADRCADPPKSFERPPVRYTTWSCAEGTRVSVAVVRGMGHDWPGARPADLLKRALRRPPGPLDATTFLWTNLRDAGLS